MVFLPFTGNNMQEHNLHRDFHVGCFKGYQPEFGYNGDLVFAKHSLDGACTFLIFT
jgi:hypothetical protein